MTLHTKKLKELKELISKNEINSTELTKHFLDRIEKYSDINAFNHIDQEQTLEQTKNFIKDKKLSGIPVAIKDLVLTKGMKTTACSKILENFIPPYNATAMTNIYNEGGINLGKTNMDEFAMGSSTEYSHFGKTKNPWDLERVPGGSSGGSAAAVAARVATVAIGSDTGGSIRQPASFCGVVGIKPTYGRISRYGVVAYASSLDQLGVFGSSVEDTAYFLEVLSGKDAKDSTSVNKEVPNFSEIIKQGDIKGLRVGVPKEYFIDGLDLEVKESVQNALKKLESLGAEIVEISLPHTEYALATYYIIAPAEASSNLSRYDGIKYGYRAKDTKNLEDLYSRSRSEAFGDEVKRRIIIGSFVLSSGYYDAYYIKAQKVRSLIAKDFTDAFKDKCDVIACPTSPTTAFKAGQKTNDPMTMYLNDVFTIPLNLAGLPGLSVPCGFDSKGLPIGIQILGNAWDEGTILKTAYQLEQSLNLDLTPNLIKG